MNENFQPTSWKTAFLWTIALWIPLAAMQFLWVRRDTRPLDADPANHAIRALDYAHTLLPLRHMPGSYLYFWRKSYGIYTYPPLYHIILGLFCRFISQPSWGIIATNMSFLALLLYSVIQIGRRAFDLTIGIAAAALAAMFNYSAYLQHEAFIEFALTSACAYAVWRLLQTRGFSLRRQSLAAGVCIGLAILIKHMAAVYLAGPVICVLWSQRRTWNKDKIWNAHLSMGVALIIALSWYALHFHDILLNLKANQEYPDQSGVPSIWTIPGMLYYLCAMWSEQMGCVVFILMLGAVYLWIARSKSGGADSDRRQARGIILAYFLIGLLLLTFVFKNKNARFSTPILPGAALFICGGIGFIRSRAAQRWAIAILALGTLPYYTAAMFDWPPVSRDISFQVAGLDWEIWTSKMQEGPRNEQWPVIPILERVMSQWNKIQHDPTDRPRLGLLPYFTHFSPRGFALEAETHQNLPIDIGNAAIDPDTQKLDEFDFLLAKPGDQGIEFLSHYAAEFRDYILVHPAKFHLVGTFMLPDRSIVELYQVAPITQTRMNSSP